MRQRAIVVGAGLAGSSAAERLAARGWQIDLVERAPAPAQGASGNLAGVLRPLPSVDDNRLAQLTRAAFLYACRHFADLTAAGLPLRWQATGVLHLARDAPHAANQRRVVALQSPSPDYLQFVDQEAASTLAGWPLSTGGWWFPGGGWVDPVSLCRANLSRYRQAIRPHYDCEVATIERVRENWRVFTASARLLCVAEAPVLILANAAAVRRFPLAWHLPLRSARGQVTHLAAVTGSPPPLVVCRLGYVTPAIDGVRCVGATFAVDEDDGSLRADDDLDNLAKLDFMLPDFARTTGATTIGGRVGFRPLPPDRLPIVGAVGDATARPAGAGAVPLATIPSLPGLYTINGFGARGIVWSALAGELLACLITGESPPLASELVAALDPRRFLRRRTPAERVRR